MKSSGTKIASKLQNEFWYHIPATHPKKIVFDHLPKCGGSTLSAYLESHYPKRKIFSIDGSAPLASVNEFKALPMKRRFKFCLVKGHLANDLFDYVSPECLKVTILRDPVDRIISHYFFAKRNHKHYLYQDIHNYNMTLEDYAISNLSGELRNWYTTHFSGLSVNIAENRPEESLAKACDALVERYNIVGFLEDFSSFIRVLRNKANLRFNYTSNRVNVTKDRPRIEDIPKSIIHKIEQVNFLDILLYKRIRKILC